MRFFSLRPRLLCVSVVAFFFFPREALALITSCTITTTAHAFGNYNVFSGPPLNTTSNIRIRCTGSGANPIGAVTVTLSKGAAPMYNPRTMVFGVNTLTYNLYFNAARTQIWGDGTGGTVVWTRSVNGNTNYSRTVYGRIPAGQDAFAGAYTDTIVATILW